MAKLRKEKTRTAQERTRVRRARLRARGLRPVQHWVLDLRDPSVRTAIRREAEKLARHPDNATIDDWIDAAYDWSEWK